MGWCAQWKSISSRMFCFMNQALSALSSFPMQDSIGRSLTPTVSDLTVWHLEGNDDDHQC